MSALLCALSVSPTKAVMTLGTITAFPQRTVGGLRRPRKEHRGQKPRQSCFFVKSITFSQSLISYRNGIGEEQEFVRNVF